MKIDKQSVVDAAWSLLGGIIGGVAVGAWTLHRYLSTPVQGSPEGVPGEPARRG